MQELLQILFNSGKSSVNLVLYTLIPIMVVMLALMRYLECIGFLKYISKLWISNIFSKGLQAAGIPGIGIVAVIQILFVSFAAPVATLKIMDEKGISGNHISATLAMVLTMSQANAVYPLVTVGLNYWTILITSIIGGVVSSIVTYYYLAKPEEVEFQVEKDVEKKDKSENFVVATLRGGQEGFEIALKSVPILVLGFLVANTLVIPLETFNLSNSVTLVVITKFVAGGTAMMGIAIEHIQNGSLTALELNKIAGFIVNPLDIVGCAVLMQSGKRVYKLIWVAIKGAIVGILTRGLLQLIFFSL